MHGKHDQHAKIKSQSSAGDALINAAWRVQSKCFNDNKSDHSNQGENSEPK